MNQTKEHHHLAVELLEILGLDSIRLERQKQDSFRYVAWNTPLAEGNGTAKKIKCGILKLKRS